MKSKLLLGIVASATFAFTNPAVAQVTLVDYNFNALTVNTALVGQDGWVNFATSGSTGPFVRSVTPTDLPAQQGAAWATDAAVTQAFRSFGDFDLSSDAIVTLEFDMVKVGGSAQAVAGIGNVTQAVGGTIPAYVGSFSSQGFIVREYGQSATIHSAVDSLGVVVLPVQGDLYRIRSVWDLSAATATLEIMNLSEGETGFTTLYFNAAQTQSTVSLGTLVGVGDWDDFFMRTGGSAGQGGFIDNISVTAIPEPGVMALLGGAAALLALGRRRK